MGLAGRAGASADLLGTRLKRGSRELQGKPKPTNTYNARAALAYPKACYLHPSIRCRLVRNSIEKYCRCPWTALLGPRPRPAWPGLVQTSSQKCPDVLSVPLERSPLPGPRPASAGLVQTRTLAWPAQDYYRLVHSSTQKCCWCHWGTPPNLGLALRAQE